MARSRYYIRQYGMCWSLTEEAFRRFLENGAADRDWNLDNYGKRLRRCPPDVDAKPLDWRPGDFVFALYQFDFIDYDECLRRS